jgi:pimeloyl-ACP methyl ester carboxylesterase
LKNFKASKSVSYKLNLSYGEWEYNVYGNGPKIMVAFPGFGQYPVAYKILARALPDYRIFGISMPFHGQTKMKEPATHLLPESVAELMDALMHREKITSFDLVGFSIGVRLMIPILQTYTKNVGEIIFLAPDFGQNFWYRLATGTSTMRTLFKYTMLNGNILHRIVNFASILHLFSENTLILARRTTRNQDARMRVFNTWCFLRKLKYDKTEISKLITETGPKFKLVAGKNDEVISLKAFSSIRNANSNVEYLELESSHNDLIEQYAKYLMDRD